MGRIVPSWLDRRAQGSPDHPALLIDGRSVTYGELAERAMTASGRLWQLGVRRGDCVAVLLRNGLELVEVMYGLMRLGAVLVPLNRRLAAPEIQQQVHDVSASLLLYDQSTRDLIGALEHVRVPIRACVDGEGFAGDVAVAAVPATRDPGSGRIDLEAVHTVIYTSGSSGRPKGVRLTYGNHFSSAAGSAFNLGVQGDDRWLASLPFCHVGGLSILLRSVIYGTTAVVHDGFDPERVNHSIDADRVTIISVVANMLQRMIEARGARRDPPWLRCVLLGGGPAPRALLDACAVRGIPVVQTYGLTEAASQVTTLAPRDARRKLGSAGTPLLTTEVSVVTPRGPAASDEIGEIVVRGPTVSPGYIGDPATLGRPDGWFRTGDLGRFDADGFLYVVGRQDEMIISGGENVAPAEVEGALQQHPDVAEACVFGIADADWGETVAACVRLRPGAETTPEALQVYVRRLLAGFKVPRRIFCVGDFPRTASGKIIRRRVRSDIEHRGAIRSAGSP